MLRSLLVDFLSLTRMTHLTFIYISIILDQQRTIILISTLLVLNVHLFLQLLLLLLKGLIEFLCLLNMILQLFHRYSISLLANHGKVWLLLRIK